MEAAYLRIVPSSQATPEYLFEFRSPYDVRPVLVQEARTVPGLAHLVEMAQGLRSTMINLPDLSLPGVVVDGPDRLAPFQRLGQLIFERMLPPAIAEALRQLPPDTSLVLSTTDTRLPWELMHDGQAFLMLKLHLARWLMVRSDYMAPIPSASPGTDKTRTLLVASNPRHDLPHVTAEIESLDELLGEQMSTRLLSGKRATLSLVTRLLREGNHQLIHFSGHTRPATEADPAAFLLAEERPLHADNLPLLPNGPVIFLNACSSADETGPVNRGGAIPLEFVYHGLASAFVEAGARAVIGTLWPVSDLGAHRFAELFYQQALAGSTFGQALDYARQTIQTELDNDPIWAAYIFYGNPADRLLPEPATESVDSTASEPRLAEWVSVREAAAFLELSYRQAWQLSGQIRTRRHKNRVQLSGEDVVAMKAGRAASAEQAAGPAPTCARCGRLLRAEEESFTCRQAGCEAALCPVCWQAADDRYCYAHALTPAQQLAQAQTRLETGEIPLLLPAEEARQAGRGFIQRFDQRLRARSEIVHPQTNRAIRVKDWTECHTTGSEKPGSNPAGHPNEPRLEKERSCYELPGRPPVVIEAFYVTRSGAMDRQGFDTAPLNQNELQLLLEERLANLSGSDLVVVGMASPTGWDETARNHLDTAQEGRAFFHNALIPFLVDLPAQQVIYNRYEQRAKPLAYLFRPLSLVEEKHRLKQRLIQELRASYSLSLDEVCRWSDTPAEVVEAIFEEMAQTGRYHLDKAEETGLLIMAAEI